jgi:hypothetical protein
MFSHHFDYFLGLIMISVPANIALFCLDAVPANSKIVVYSP